jgi:dCTP deaminase
MLLSDKELKELIKHKYIPDNVFIGPSSIDLTLSNSFCWPCPENGIIELGKPVEHESVIKDEFELKPGEFVLASSNEDIGIPEHMAGYVEGRSSIGRLGLQVQNASFIDAGFRGRITLELANQSQYPILLKSGIRVCQLVLFQMTSSADSPYCGKYNGQYLATPSRLERDFDSYFDRSI